MKFSLEIDGSDDESRAIVADYGGFILFNVYFPMARHPMSGWSTS